MPDTEGVLAPLVVFNCRDEQWRGQPDVLAWMRAEGLDPESMYRLEVYLVDCPSARVYEYVTLLGKRFYIPEWDEFLKRDPYNVILSSLPPETPAKEE